MIKALQVFKWTCKIGGAACLVEGINFFTDLEMFETNWFFLVGAVFAWYMLDSLGDRANEDIKKLKAGMTEEEVFGR